MGGKERGVGRWGSRKEGERRGGGWRGEVGWVGGGDGGRGVGVGGGGKREGGRKGK